MKLIEKKLSKQDIIYTAIFGAIWGIIEVTLGTTLHISKIPFRGIVMSFISVIILVNAKEFTRYRGSLIVIGAIAATFKGLSLGGFVLTPMLAIFIESIIAEIVQIFLGINLLSSFIFGASILIYTFIHGLVMQIFYFGMNIYKVYMDIFGIFSAKSQVKEGNLLILFIILLIIHALIGGVGGIFGRKVAIRTRMILSEEKT